MPTMTPKSPRALPKIYTTRIFTKESGFWASAIAHPLPEIPTQILNKGEVTRRRGWRNPPIFQSRRGHSHRTWAHRCIILCIRWLFPAEWWPWWPHRWPPPHRRWHSRGSSTWYEVLLLQPQEYLHLQWKFPCVNHFLPCCTHDRGSQSQCDSDICPRIWWYRVE